MTTVDKLSSIAENLWWSWNPGALSLFRRLNPDVFEASNNNPRIALRHARDSVVADPAFAADVDRIYSEFGTYVSAESARDYPITAYMCMEFGLHESLPLYSGGLGILAGDHLKAASDLNLPLVAIGLFLRDGYFKQYFDSLGNQQAAYPGIDVTAHPIDPVLSADGKPLLVQVELGHQPLFLQAWKLQVGRVTLYLLDSDVQDNPYSLRFLTRRLYAGGRLTRLRQEIILGVGGIRLLRALGITPHVVHLNEGHCAFATFEMLRERIGAGQYRSEAEELVRKSVLFTTHTPVKAGHDRFEPGLMLDQLAGLRQELGMSEHDFLAFGRVNAHDASEHFTMTVLALRLSTVANGVSRLNGEVARAQWHQLYPGRHVSQVPISHITNGVHLPTWIAPSARPFIRTHVPDWNDSPDAWDGIINVADEDLWKYREQLRRNLVDFVTQRVNKQTLSQQPNLDPHALTIGFARRFATYKRAPLFFHDVARAKAIIGSSQRPVQLIFAGKAHPADREGQGFIQLIFEMTQDADFNGKVVFLEDYDMNVGRMLVSGADVWLNNPRRPYEASGTSGQKVAAHGGLNLSILDGWWPEGFDGENGWAIGTDATSDYKDPAVQDPEDADLLYRILTEDVVPAFYSRDDRNLPTKWIAKMRKAMTKLPYQFSARRMVGDYAILYRGIQKDTQVKAS